MEPNAEAGPSKLSSTPPDTPPAAKPRRRSWFGFGSPSSPASTKSKAPRRDSLVMVNDEVELQLVSENRKAGGAVTPSERKRPDEPADGPVEDELLTIDGDPEMTIKTKKKSWSQGGRASVGDSEAVRMRDMSSLNTKDSPDNPSRMAHDPGGALAELPGIVPRTFARKASDRDVFASNPTPRPLTAPQLTPRISSIPQTQTPSPTIPIIYTDKPQPPVPLLERPLPDLPPSESDIGPTLPQSIVVTPSSPRRLKKPPRSASASTERSSRLDDRRRSSASSSKTTRKAQSARSSPIGLGLPRDLVRSGSLDNANGDDQPPPVPAKSQAVSSPLPSRSASPVPRIMFAEPDAVKSEQAPGKEDKVADEKKTRVKRARSLSGVFGRAKPVVVASTSGKNSPNEVQTPDSEKKEEMLMDEPPVTRSKGVLEWLGVKKTVKRRQSEGKLNALSDGNGDGQQSRGRTPNQSRENLRLDAGATLRRPSRPNLRTDTSNVTLMPSAQRRSSSITGRDSSEAPIEARPIPNASNRHSASSSRSSLVLSATSPTYPASGPWTSTPSSEAEEMLFSPGTSAHWGPGIRPWMDGPTVSIKSSSSSPLSSLPESGILASVVAQSASQQGNRIRSWSDAPRPQPVPERQNIPTNNSNPHLPPTDDTAPLSQSLQRSPFTPPRPKMPSRSSSGNSAVMGRMRAVFAKTTSRGRSHSLLRQPSSDMDDFGAIRSPRENWQGGATMRPSSSSSSEVISPRLSSDVNQMSLLGLQGGERQIFLNDATDRSPRLSGTPAASVLSFATTSTRLSGDQQGGKKLSKARARASTISAGPTSYSFSGPPAPPSPSLFPVAATPPRRRPSLIQRISSSRLGGAPTPQTSSLFPLPPRSSGSMSSSTGLDDGMSSGLLSPGTSPRPSTGSVTLSAVKAAMNVEEGETPELWVARVVGTVGRADISSVLAASADEFHTEALRLYMSRFDFTHNPLDVALRQLLMQLSLPKETQQIDRIIEAFSVRYEECEPGLFAKKDNTYVLAFSMMMLHTDAFNKHNKNKMTKPDYIRNTRMEGVLPTVLEAFFDNITYIPFVFIEDDISTASSLGLSMPSQTTGSKSAKIDVYDMIARGLLGTLRIDVEQSIPSESPFSAFTQDPYLLQIVPPAKRKNSAAGLLSTTPSKASAPEPDVILRITKVGLLSRKDDLGGRGGGEGDKKSSAKKWKSWSVILTSSQLLFFKDPTWALSLMDQMRKVAAAANGGEDGLDEKTGMPVLQKMSGFKPDEVFPIKECVAVYDQHFLKNANAFRFIMPDNRQYLLQASDEHEMNEWIGLINYASAFKTAEVQMRGSSMGQDRAVLAGAAAAASHRRDVELVEADGQLSSVAKKSFGDRSSEDTKTDGARQSSGEADRKRDVTLVDSGGDEAPDPGQQLEDVFDTVKAELAAGRGGATRIARPQSPHPHVGSGNAGGFRSDALQTHLDVLQSRASAIQADLRTLLLQARNLSILTPFQRSTREIVTRAVHPLAHKIRQRRVELAKVEVWILILRKDLDKERQEWARVRHVALQAATQSLSGRGGLRDVVLGVAEGNANVIPSLTLPIRTKGVGGECDGEKDGSDRADEDKSPIGELPVNIRQRSEEDQRGSNSSGRKMSGETSGRASRAGPGAGLLSPDDALRADSPLPSNAEDENGFRDSASGRSTPILYAMSNDDDDNHDGIAEAQGRAGSEGGEEEADEETAHGHSTITVRDEHVGHSAEEEARSKGTDGSPEASNGSMLGSMPGGYANGIETSRNDVE